jgi:hypothetical protein
MSSIRKWQEALLPKISTSTSSAILEVITSKKKVIILTV